MPGITRLVKVDLTKLEKTGADVSALFTSITDAQAFMRQRRIPAWLLYDYHSVNPVMWRLLGHVAHITRPSWCLVPRDGQPQLLVHHVDAGKFEPLGLPMHVFSSRAQQVALLRKLLHGISTVAMEYSPKGELPRASRVDAGTVELVRSLGVRVVSSADLFQYATQRWTPAQLATHTDAAIKLTNIVGRAFTLIRESSRKPTEWEAAQFIRDQYKAEHLTVPDGPIVAIN